MTITPYDAIQKVHTPAPPSKEEAEYKKRLEEQMRRRYPSIPEMELQLEAARENVIRLQDWMEPERAKEAHARKAAKAARDAAVVAEKVAATARSTHDLLDKALKQAERDRNEELRTIGRLEEEIDKVKRGKERVFVPGEGLVFVTLNTIRTLHEDQRNARDEIDRAGGQETRSDREARLTGTDAIRALTGQ